MAKILNVSGETAELLLHGVVGDEINGTIIANKLQSLKEFGVKKVIERINSRGGSIVDGYSIVAANLNLTYSGVIVETINEGVADSMASVILASGTKGYRKANDYARAVVHNPLFNGTSLNDMEDSVIKETLTAFKESLITIYAAAVGKTKEEISETMNQEKMLNADQMKAFGIIDQVVPTNISLPIKENMSLAEIMNVFEGYNNKSITNKNKNMSKLNEFYNLSKDASDDSLLEAAKAERDKLNDAEAKVNDLEKELDLKEKELEKFQDEATKMAVNSAIESGKFDKKDESQLLSTCKSIGLDNFNAMVEKMITPHVDVAGMIANKSGSAKKLTEYQKEVDGKIVEKVYEDYKPSELEKIQSVNPEKFEAIINEWNERD